MKKCSTLRDTASRIGFLRWPGWDSLQNCITSRLTAYRYQSGRRLTVRCSTSLSCQHTEFSFMNPIPKLENPKSTAQDRISSVAGLGIAPDASICRETWNVCQQCTQPILYQFSGDSELKQKSLPYLSPASKGSFVVRFWPATGTLGDEISY